jgi:predicted Zn-ribbon and HTH transcriptional regulator
MSDNVITFPGLDNKSTNLACPRCGSEWWESDAMTLDADTRHVTGYALPVTCHECGWEDGAR